MSKTQCRHFVQNAWKKELCSNCFKSREEHTTTQEQFKPNITRTANNLKKVAHKVQGILRMKESHTQVRSKRKNVAFPESLTEIIGYDGGDDFGLDDDTSHDHDDPDNTNESSFEIDDLPDSEEERALGNLTRANTNFNTVTANLNNAIEEAKTATKNFSTLMLGRAPKNNDGKKTTLLVSVKPFGGDDSVPTARRPSDKKSPETPKPKPTVEMSEITKTEVSSLKSVSKKPVEEKSIETTSKTITTTTNNTTSSSLGKIVDMPLITSTNLISVIRDETSVEKIEQKRTTSIARTPAIKKPENEKPKIVAQQQNTDQNAARNHKNLELSNGVELNLSPIRSNDQTRDTETSSFGKEISNYKSSLTADKRNNLADLTERKVEGEAAKNFSEKFSFEESRESAGEPDGKADEEVIAEPPALPKSPPPIETTFVRTCLESEKRTLLSSTSTSAIAEPRTSFLHGMTEPKVKPVVPQKPLTLPAKAIGSSLASLLSENRAYEFRISQSQRNSALVHSQSESQLCAGTDEMEEDDAEDDDDSEGDHPRSCSKRRMAPQPPASISEDASSSLFARNPATMVAKSDCPVVREKEKRERASSCSPKFRKAVSDAPDPCATRPPEPAPRRNISLSQDSLAAATNCERVTEEKKKARSKFSLKKFLRMGSRKDVDMTAIGSRSEEIPSTPQPKPRLEIIHPLELDGAAVQVLRNDKTTSEDTTDSKSENLNSGTSPAHGAQHVTTRPSKPPPPPRTQSLDESSKPRVSAPKPQQQQQQTNSSSSNSSKPLVGKSWQPSNGSSASDSIYANLGAIRSTLAPAKPRRTSSMRDQVQQPINSNNKTQTDAGTGAPAVTGQQRQCGIMMDRQRLPTSLDSPTSNDNQAFENSSSSIDCDNKNGSVLELRQGSGNYPITKRQSDSGALESKSNEVKFQQSLFTRSTSLPYCASEAENDMYSPFCYHHGDETSEDSQDYKKDEESRIGRLRQRRGRSIVHRSLEDNYGAVIVANHEALAQFLEQMNQSAPLAAGLRSLKAAQSLQFRDFVIDKNSAVACTKRIFFSANWNEQNVSLCVAFDRPSMHISHKEFYLVPIVEFIDTVPMDIADMSNSLGRKNTEATISVLPRLQVNTIKSFAETISSNNIKEEHVTRESSFVLLQLVSALKSLQARGIEEAPSNLTNVVLCREEKDAYHKLYLFQGLNIDSYENNDDDCVSLCQCALNALKQLNLAKKLPLIQELLMRERAVTLSQVKSILEFSLWGPADATLGGPRERELALQRWLDLERATVLHALVRARAHLTVTDEYQLLFLVRTSAKIMCEASLLLDKQKNGILLPRNST